MATTAVASPATKWWVPLVAGILAIIVGILFLTQPAITAAAFVLALGIWWAIRGVLDLLSLFQDRTAWGWKLFAGILGIVAGLIIIGGFFWRGNAVWTTLIVGIAFVWIVGVMGIVYGIIGLIAAFQGGGWAAGILGALSILFGIILIARPAIATLSLPLVFGILAIVEGIFLIIAAFRMRQLR